MPDARPSRRMFVSTLGALTVGCRSPGTPQPAGPADYTLTMAVKPVELAPNRIVSTTTYNGQFPGPLLRL